MYLALGILILGISIAFHEFGHFVALKRLGYNVKNFSVGFGPGVSWNRGGTTYSVNVLLFGGYVEHDGDRTPWRDLIVALAGPAASAVAALLCFYVVGYFKSGVVNPMAAVAVMVEVFTNVVSSLTSGTEGSAELSGPVGILSELHKSKSLFDVVIMAGVINYSLALFNLLPIPPLDGGNALFCVIRMLTRRSLVRIRGVAATVGAVMFLAIIAYATFNDVAAFF